MTLRLEIKWAEEVTEKLRKIWKEDLSKARDKRLKESAILLQWASKKETPVDNWILRKSIKYAVHNDYAVVYSNLFYAPFVHEWTRPHLIRPVKKKSLFRIDEEWGHFAKLVHHPGSKENPFFTRAVNNNQEKIVQRFYEIIDEYIND